MSVAQVVYGLMIAVESRFCVDIGREGGVSVVAFLCARHQDDSFEFHFALVPADAFGFEFFHSFVTTFLSLWGFWSLCVLCGGLSMGLEVCKIHSGCLDEDEIDIVPHFHAFRIGHVVLRIGEDFILQLRSHVEVVQAYEELDYLFAVREYILMVEVADVNVHVGIL